MSRRRGFSVTDYHVLCLGHGLIMCSKHAVTLPGWNVWCKGAGGSFRRDEAPTRVGRGFVVFSGGGVAGALSGGQVGYLRGLLVGVGVGSVVQPPLRQSGFAQDMGSPPLGCRAGGFAAPTKCGVDVGAELFGAGDGCAALVVQVADEDV